MMIGLLGSLLGGQGGRMIGGMLGGRTGAMIGGLLGSLIGGRRLGRSLGRGGGLGGLLGDDGRSDPGGRSGPGGPASALGGDDSEQLTEAEAALLIRAMTNAAKSDGSIDQTEFDSILDRLKGVSDEEIEFLHRELTTAFVPAERFAASVHRHLAAEAYVVSATAVAIDTNAENDYLVQLADGLGIEAVDRNALHAELGIAPVE